MKAWTKIHHCSRESYSIDDPTLSFDEVRRRIRPRPCSCGKPADLWLHRSWLCEYARKDLLRPIVLPMIDQGEGTVDGHQIWITEGQHGGFKVYGLNGFWSTNCATNEDVVAAIATKL